MPPVSSRTAFRRRFGKLRVKVPSFFGDKQQTSQVDGNIFPQPPRVGSKSLLGTTVATTPKLYMIHTGKIYCSTHIHIHDWIIVYNYIRITILWQEWCHTISFSICSENCWVLVGDVDFSQVMPLASGSRTKKMQLGGKTSWSVDGVDGLYIILNDMRLKQEYYEYPGPTAWNIC